MIPNPAHDGVRHINIYSKGLTDLGVRCSHFTRDPFDLPGWGKFASVEALWYYMSVSPEEPLRESLRGLSGFDAKRAGRNLRADDWPGGGWNAAGIPISEEQFQDTIRAANRLRVENDPAFKQMLVESELPFLHYYVFKGRVYVPEQGGWILDFWEDLRTELQKAQG